MSVVSLKAAKAGLSSYVDEALKGDFVTITRHGRPVAAIVSIEAADVARKALAKARPNFGTFLQTFPGGDLARNRSPSRDVDL